VYTGALRFSLFSFVLSPSVYFFLPFCFLFAYLFTRENKKIKVILVYLNIYVGSTDKGGK
jgi:hypothetical protein